MSWIHQSGALVLTLCMVSGQSNPYCDPSKYGNYAEIGTLCLYQNKTGATCGRIIRGNDSMTEEVRNHILDVHNKGRSRVASGNETNGSPGPQPKASKMGELKWNSRLALAAQTWANQCLFRTDDNRNETKDAFDPDGALAEVDGPIYVGQNVYGFVDIPATYVDVSDIKYYWDQAIMRWYSEVKNYPNSSVGEYVYSVNTGHYAQIVNEKTTDIGCGFNQWERPTDRIKRILVCNYGQGLIPGESVYTVGEEACSACENTCVNETKLCSASNDDGTVGPGTPMSLTAA